MFKIRCTVSGGRTGYRTAYLKSEGQEVEFETLEDAQAEADKLTKDMNAGSNGARFTYTPEAQ